MKRRVLIIDNDPVIHVSLLGVLSNNEIEVYSVYNPFNAFQWLEKSSADLIICDIGLPKMNGLEFVRQLRQKNKTMGVLFFTGGEVEIAKTELKKRNFLNSSGENETGYLSPLLNMAEEGKTLADTMLQKYLKDWNKDPKKAIENQII